MNDLLITFYGQTIPIVKFSVINPYLPTIHGWIKGVVYVLLVFYNINQVLKLIRCTDYISPGQTSQGTVDNTNLMWRP